MNLVTLSDNKYLRQGELLYESLLEHNPHFVMHYLCLDEQTLNVMTKKNRCKAYAYEEIESNILKNHRMTHTWEQHCWSLASYFLRWLRDQGVGDMLYIDADIFFYDDPGLIFDEVGEHSIGIITHRFGAWKERIPGHYNVGVIYFADTEIGSACLEWWSTVVLDETLYPEYSTCGDQKYLELFEEKFGDVCVIDEQTGHAAPWNAYRQDYDGKYITWQGKKQRFVFYHFSHFSWDDKGYRTNRHGEWTPEIDKKWAKELYDDYYKLIKN